MKNIFGSSEVLISSGFIWSNTLIQDPKIILTKCLPRYSYILDIYILHPKAGRPMKITTRVEHCVD